MQSTFVEHDGMVLVKLNKECWFDTSFKLHNDYSKIQDLIPDTKSLTFDYLRKLKFTNSVLTGIFGRPKLKLKKITRSYYKQLVYLHYAFLPSPDNMRKMYGRDLYTHLIYLKLHNICVPNCTPKKYLNAIFYANAIAPYGMPNELLEVFNMPQIELVKYVLDKKKIRIDGLSYHMVLDYQKPVRR